MKGRGAVPGILGAMMAMRTGGGPSPSRPDRRLFDMSVEKPESGRPLPKGKQYARHTGAAQRRRYQRQHARPVLKSKDPEVVAARERLRAACAGEHDPEGEFLQIVAETWSESLQERRPWPAIVNTMLDQFETADAELEDGP